MVSMLQAHGQLEQVLVGTKPANIPEFHGWGNTALAIPALEYQRRLAAVQTAMAAEQLDVLMVRGPEDVRYLTGFHTIGDAAPQTVLLPAQGAPHFVARLIEVDLVVKHSWVPLVWSCPDAVSTTVPCEAAVKELLKSALAARAAKDGTISSEGSCLTDSKLATLGVQLEQLSASYYEEFSVRLTQDPAMEAIRVKDASKLVERIRLQRSQFELECLSRASLMGEHAMSVALATVQPGVPLSRLHSCALAALFDAGSEAPAYQPIVRSTDPSGHGGWEVGEAAQRNALVFLELAGSVLGHHAPLMRTAYIVPEGEEQHLPQWLCEAERLIRQVFETCLPMMLPGAQANEIDRVGRQIMESNSFGGLMSARLGYTAGGTATNPAGNAGWGDADFSLVAHNTEPLREGMTFHFIPWFQVYGDDERTGGIRGPVGLSDLVLVTPEGGKRLGKLPLNITLIKC